MSAVLIVSPVPSHPPVQGNSARILRLGRLLRDLGHHVHFLYHGMEGLTPAQRRAMTVAWDHFHFVGCVGDTVPASLGDDHHLDDWWDERVGQTIRAVCDRWAIRACIVNYVWYSRAFLALPEGVVRILDTHDVFARRHELARQQGLTPSWYSTSDDEEARGLTRADVVVAIQDAEAAHFRRQVERNQGATRVETIGYVAPAVVLPPPPPSPVGRLRLGYLGSGNPWNVRAMEGFLDALADTPDLAARCEVVMAGSICGRIVAPAGLAVRMIGLVPEPSDLYRQADAVVNPMVGGTGLKIKTVEAMAYGLAQICTVDASAGLGEVPEWMRCSDPAAMIPWLRRWCDDAVALAGASAGTAALYRAYANAQHAAAVRDLGAAAEGRLP